MSNNKQLKEFRAFTILNSSEAARLNGTLEARIETICAYDEEAAAELLDIVHDSIPDHIEESPREVTKDTEPYTESIFDLTDIVDAKKDEVNELLRQLDLEPVFTGEENYRELYSKVVQYIEEDRITYCKTAIQYLMDNDAGLFKSIELAAEKGYTLEDINSEILASELYQHNLRESLNMYSSELEELVDEYHLIPDQVLEYAFESEAQ